jgi:hypothetical protein
LEMFTGEVNWQSGVVAGYALEAYLKHGSGDAELAATLPSLPAGVAELLRRCFQIDPAKRPQTMAECAAELLKIYEAVCGEPYPRPEPQVVGDTAGALNNRALSLLDLGRPEEAEALFEQALELDKQHLDVAYNRGLARWRRGRVTDQELLFALEQLAKDRPADPGLEEAQGWVCLESGRFKAAVAHFEKALELGAGAEARRGFKMARPPAEENAGECLRTFEGHAGPVNPVAFSPDGRYCLSGSFDKTLKLWELSTGDCLRTFKGHTSGVLSVAISPDGRYCLSGSRDKTIKLWEFSTGDCLRTFEGHTNDVNSVAISPDGRYCLSGSKDHTIKLWELDWAYEFPGWDEWDAGAEPYLQNYLTLQTPAAAQLPADREPTPKKVTAALTRQGKPAWTEEDFTALLLDLSRRGYGWLKPEGVRRKLEEMAKTEPC